MDKDEKLSPDSNTDKVGFGWWKAYAWLGLVVGNFFILGTFSHAVGLALCLVILNSIICTFILKMNKYAFLLATVISFNPLVWIANGIYLRNRWNHPLLNDGKEG